MRQATINEIAYIGANTSGAVSVTGGTEAGVHAEVGTYSHVNGYKVDIDNTANVNAYVAANFTPYSDPNRSGVRAYKNPQTGAVWYQEGNHWDVLVK